MTKPDSVANVVVDDALAAALGVFCLCKLL